MSAPTVVICAWLLFGGTHLLLGLPPRRDYLARRLGEQAFVAMFSAVAAVALALLAVAIASVGGEGPVGPALGDNPLGRAVLVTLALMGLTLSICGLLNYLRSPMALFRTQLHPPAGIERITRHAFFMGLSLFAIAHSLLATTLAICIYFAGFAALATIGALLQDRKLLARHGAAYARYMATTSVLPFLALMQRRQTITSADRLWRQFALSSAVALLLLVSHPLWSALHGAPFAGVMAIGGLYAAARRWKHSRTAARTLAQEPQAARGES